MTTIAFLPGLLCDEELWKETAAHLAAALGPCRIEILSLGDTTTIADMADDVASRLPGQVVLVGHSLGALVALELASRYADRVAALGLVCMGIKSVGPGEGEARRVVVREALSSGIEAIAGHWSDVVLGKDADPGIRDRALAMAGRMPAETYAAHIEAFLSRVPIEDRLRVINVPAILVNGGRDALAPPQDGQWASDRIDRATVASVPCAAHLLPLEQPAALARLLVPFIEAHSGNA
jgi:pimeloyl-ACP methyl ester carboxylesterase